MFFLTPRYIKDARHLHQAAKKLLQYRRDLWTDDQIAHFEQELADLKKAIKARNPSEVQSLSEVIQTTADRYAPPPPDSGWRENCEVIIIAIIIAAGIRAYFLQPFKIPTGSMQPTLYGIVGESTPRDVPIPNPLIRAFEMLQLGRTYIDVIAKNDSTLIGLQEQTYLHFFTFTKIVCNNDTYTVFAPADTLTLYFGLMPGVSFQKGDAIVHGYVDTGDQVFVDKLSYNFIPPQRGNVFVFKTTNIKRIEEGHPPEMGSQHYIKRLAGLPGDTLRIDSPSLYINEKLAEQEVFQRVMSAKNGYRGYSNPPHSFLYLTTTKSKVTVPPKYYFALGDNSYNSSDSRYWGFVPEQNVAGKGFLVYWPFSKRWGLIH
ncbi:MAG: signal peptidase I [Chthoniobacterales bacterium]